MITTTELAQVFAAANGESIQANIAQIRVLAAHGPSVDAPAVASDDPAVEAWHDDDADELCLLQIAGDRPSVAPEEIDAWLGDTELTAEQRAKFDVEVAAIGERYDDRDDSELRDAALSVSLQFILGQLDLPSVAWPEYKSTFRAVGAVSPW